MKVGHTKPAMKKTGLPISITTLNSNVSELAAPSALIQSGEANIDVFSSEVAWARLRLRMNIV